MGAGHAAAAPLRWQRGTHPRDPILDSMHLALDHVNVKKSNITWVNVTVKYVKKTH